MDMGQTCCDEVFFFFFWDYEWWLDEEGSGCLVDGNLEDEFSMVCWNEKHNKDFFFFFFSFYEMDWLALIPNVVN